MADKNTFQKNPFAWLIGGAVGVVLLLTGWLNANQNWDTTREIPIPDVRIRN